MTLHHVNRLWIISLLGAVTWALGTSTAVSHPLFGKYYERTVDVQLSADATGWFNVEVRYELELNQFTALTDAQRRLQELGEEPPGKQAEYFDAFTRVFAPILAEKLYAHLDEQYLELACVQRGYRVKKDDGTLHCTFVFRARAKPLAAAQHFFTFEEGAYKEEAGRVLLSLSAGNMLNVLGKVEPSAELKSRPVADLKIGDDERMRQASATFAIIEPPPLTVDAISAPAITENSAAPSASLDE